MPSKEVNPFEAGPYAYTIAFHDFKIKEIRIREVFDYIVSLFREFNVEPTRMGVTSPLDKSKTMNTFIRERKKLEKYPADAIMSICLDAQSYGDLQSLKNDLIGVYFNRSNLGHCVLVFDAQFFSFEKEKTKEICLKIISFLSPQYAYMFKREFKKGPEFYPSGVLCGISGLKGMKDYSPEAEFLTQWSHKLDQKNPDAYKTGDLRDIYPVQLLKTHHLRRTVLKDISLKEFIQRSPSHGLLYLISDELTTPEEERYYLWYVEESEIDQIREKLRPSGVLIAI